MSSEESIRPRAHDRFRLDPMNTAVTVRRIEGRALRTLEGHAYDVSEAGLRIEIDRPLAVGEVVEVTLRLPGEVGSVDVSARVVWVNGEDDDPAARRMALAITRFRTPRDRARLVGHLGSGMVRRAA